MPKTITKKRMAAFAAAAQAEVAKGAAQEADVAERAEALAGILTDPTYKAAVEILMAPINPDHEGASFLIGPDGIRSSQATVWDPDKPLSRRVPVAVNDNMWGKHAAAHAEDVQKSMVATPTYGVTPSLADAKKGIKKDGSSYGMVYETMGIVAMKMKYDQPVYVFKSDSVNGYQKGFTEIDPRTLAEWGLKPSRVTKSLDNGVAHVLDLVKDTPQSRTVASILAKHGVGQD